MNPSTVYFQQNYVKVVIVCRHEKIIWKLIYHLFIENIFNMTKPKIYDSSRGRARTFMRDDSKTNDVFAITSLKGQTFKYFARSSDFTEGKRSLPLLCAVFCFCFFFFSFFFCLFGWLVGWFFVCLFVCLFVWFFNFFLIEFKYLCFSPMWIQTCTVVLSPLAWESPFMSTPGTPILTQPVQSTRFVC